MDLWTSFKAALGAWGFVDAAYDDPDAPRNTTSIPTLPTPRTFLSRLDYQRADFLVWAERFGFFSAQGCNSALDTPTTRAQQVKDSLDAIRFVLDKDALSQEYGLEIHGTGGSPIHAVFKDRYTRLLDAAPSTPPQLTSRGQQQEITVWESARWSISDDKKIRGLIRRVASLVRNLDELTKDIETDRSVEEIAFEAVEWFPGSTLSWIEESSLGFESLVSCVAVTRLRDLQAEINAEFGTISPPANFSLDYNIQPSFKQIDSSNHLAYGRLLANIPAPSPDEGTGPTRRILRELRVWEDEALSDWLTITPVSESNLDKFIGTIRGPEGSPYEGGIFHICLELTERYPFEPPRVWFLTKIVHPNIDWQGTVFMYILQPPNFWSPALGFAQLLLSIASLLDDPNWDSPAEWDWPEEWIGDTKAFRTRALEWTRIYATGRIVYPGARSDGFCTVNEGVPSGLKTAWDL